MAVDDLSAGKEGDTWEQRGNGGRGSERLWKQQQDSKMDRAQMQVFQNGGEMLDCVSVGWFREYYVTIHVQYIMQQVCWLHAFFFARPNFGILAETNNLKIFTSNCICRSYYLTGLHHIWSACETCDILIV